MSRAHIYYRVFKQAKIYEYAAQHSTKGHPAIYGAALHLVDYTEIGKYAVTIALIVKCTQDLQKEYLQLKEKYQKLHHAIHWQYPIINKELRLNNLSHPIISPSIFVKYQIQMRNLTQQIIKIICYAIDIFWQIFKLSMCLCDSYFILKGDSHLRYEACTELVANWPAYQEALQGNYQYLLEEIEKSHESIDRICNRMGWGKKQAILMNQLRKNMVFIKDTSQTCIQAAHQTSEIIYVPGKITPFNPYIQRKPKPFSPYQRFIPWLGQKSDLGRCTKKSSQIYFSYLLKYLPMK